MEDQIPFKVFTYWKGIEKPEVRRFEAEKCIIDSFHNLTAKLEDTYPRLRGKIYSVFWKDEEGDDVIISSRDEMLTALGAMKGLVKLYVYCKEDQSKTINLESANGVVAVNDKTYDNGNMKHFRVICDGCEGNVVGYRYKCTTCKDFDLCSKCEAAGEHPEHCMMRIPMLSTQMKIRAVIKKCSDLLSSLHERHNHHDGIYNEHNNNRTRWLETFTSFMNDYANLVSDFNCGTEKKPEAKTVVPKQSTENKTQNRFTPDTIKRLLNSYLGSLSPPRPSTPSKAKQTEDVEMGEEDRKVSDADKVSVKSNSSSTDEVKKEYSPEKAEGWTVTNKEKAWEKDDNIICDGCKNHVIGLRYKCTACYDFDLCSKCEADGLHQEHYIVRMNIPNKQGIITRAVIKRSIQFLYSIAAAKRKAKLEKLQQSTENNKQTIQVEAPSSQSIQKTQLNIEKRDRNTIKTLLKSYMLDLFAAQTKDMEMGQKDRKISDVHKDGVNPEAPSTMIGAKKQGSQEHVTGQPDMKKVKEAHIESALRDMTGMGFTNYGVWLTQLLELLTSAEIK